MSGDLDDFKRVIRWRTRRRRLELGLRQEDVAAVTGVSQKHYQMYEAGYVNFNPTLETLVKFGQALEMPVEELVREPTDKELVLSKEPSRRRAFKGL